MFSPPPCLRVTSSVPKKCFPCWPAATMKRPHALVGNWHVPLHILKADFLSLTRVADIFVGQHDFEASDWAWHVPFAVRRGGLLLELDKFDNINSIGSYNGSSLLALWLHGLRYMENAHQIWECLSECSLAIRSELKLVAKASGQASVSAPKAQAQSLTAMLSGQPRAEEHEYLALHGGINQAFPGGGWGVWHHAVPPENMKT